MTIMPDETLRADLAEHFDNVAGHLQRDITAMRDSVTPARYGDAALDDAADHFDQGFAALHAAVRGESPDRP